MSHMKVQIHTLSKPLRAFNRRSRLWTLPILDYYVTANHLADLPPGYVTKETDRFQAFFAPETQSQADRMLEAGERFIDSFSSGYSEAFGGLEPPNSRIRLTLFRNHDEFRQFARKSLQVDLSNNGGYCDAANQEIVLVMSSVERDLGKLIGPSFNLRFPTNEEADVMAMRHELVHYLMERGGDFGSRAAPWLSEDSQASLRCGPETAHRPP